MPTPEQPERRPIELRPPPEPAPAGGLDALVEALAAVLARVCAAPSPVVVLEPKDERRAA